MVMLAVWLRDLLGLSLLLPVGAGVTVADEVRVDVEAGELDMVVVADVLGAAVRVTLALADTLPGGVTVPEALRDIVSAGVTVEV